MLLPDFPRFEPQERKVDKVTTNGLLALSSSASSSSCFIDVKKLAGDAAGTGYQRRADDTPAASILLVVLFLCSACGDPILESECTSQRLQTTSRSSRLASDWLHPQTCITESMDELP